MAPSSNVMVARRVQPISHSSNGTIQETSVSCAHSISERRLPPLSPALSLDFSGTREFYPAYLSQRRNSGSVGRLPYIRMPMR